MNLQNLLLVLSNLQSCVLSIVESCLQQKSLAIFVDYFNVIRLIVQNFKEFLDLHNHKLLILATEIFPKHEIAQDLEFVLIVVRSLHMYNLQNFKNSQCTLTFTTGLPAEAEDGIQSFLLLSQGQLLMRLFNLPKLLPDFNYDSNHLDHLFIFFHLFYRMRNNHQKYIHISNCFNEVAKRWQYFFSNVLAGFFVEIEFNAHTILLVSA